MFALMVSGLSWVLLSSCWLLLAALGVISGRFRQGLVALISGYLVAAVLVCGVVASGSFRD